MKKTLIFIMAALILLGVAKAGVALSVDKTVRINIKIVPFQILMVNGKNTDGEKVITTYHIPQPTPQDLQRGYIQEDNALSLTVVSNVNWVVKVRALSKNLGSSWDGRYIKPLSDFLIRSHQTQFMPVQQIPQKIAWGKNGKKTVNIDYRVEGYNRNYHPGNYKIILEYTITTP